MKKLSLVLGGGAAKGFAHIGIIKTLEKNGIKPDLIVGTSMGALVGGMYASGMSTADMEKHALNFKSLGSFSLINTLFHGNVLNINKVKKLLEQLLGDKRHEDCETKFVAVTTELNTGKERDFDSGLLKESILASISIPIVFPTFKLEGNNYCDGGLVNNLPEDVARRITPDNVIISIDVVGPYEKQVEKNKLKVLENMVNVCSLMTQQNVDSKPQNADLRIVISQPNIKLVEFSQESAVKAINKGKNMARKYLPAIKELLKGDTNVTT